MIQNSDAKWTYQPSKGKNRGEGWWAAVFIGRISSTGPCLKPVQKGSL
jgi:hypothetical protein